jgi:hypothetical protein
LKNRSFPAQLLAGLLLATAALSLTACGNRIYFNPTTPFAGRTIPPSGLLQRVMAAYTANGSQGGLEILDGLRDIRSNVQNTIPSFSIKGFSAGYPSTIINYPEQTTGYILSYTDGSLISVNYTTEASSGPAATFAADMPSVAAAPGGILYAGAVESAGILGIAGSYGSVSLNLPNVDKVVTNPSATIVLAMVRNSNQLYRVVKLPATNTPTYPKGYIDCQPILLPIYCVVPVGNTSLVGNTPPSGGQGVGAAYDNPTNAVFSADGTSVFILNCGPECGGNTSSVTVLQQAPLLMTTVPTQDPLCDETNHPVCANPEPNPLVALPGATANPIAVPGGVTVGIADGVNLYLAGQQLQTSGANAGLYAGNLSILNLSNYTIGATYSISDGTHNKMLFADNGTLWIGAKDCALGVRAANAANTSITDQTANTNCLTRVVPNYAYNATTNANPPSILPAWTPSTLYQAGQKVCDAPSTLPNPVNEPVTVCDAGNVQVVLTAGTTGKTTPSWNSTLDQPTTDGGVVWVNLGPVSPVQIIPMITPNNKNAATNIGVMYPNTNLSNTYYGDLYGECWVQNYGKVYTSYGGQIHAFLTSDGYEINNFLITVQGTVLDVAYMDAESNSSN